jgi:hypothetical protein
MFYPAKGLHRDFWPLGLDGEQRRQHSGPKARLSRPCCFCRYNGNEGPALRSGWQMFPRASPQRRREDTVCFNLTQQRLSILDLPRQGGDQDGSCRRRLTWSKRMIERQRPQRRSCPLRKRAEMPETSDCRVGLKNSSSPPVRRHHHPVLFPPPLPAANRTASSAARTSARAFCRHSSYSASATESATIPAPA